MKHLLAQTCLVIACSAWAAPSCADIERQEQTNTLIQYIAESAYKQFEARRQELFTQAPSLITTLEFGQEIRPTMEHTSSVVRDSVISDIRYGYLGENRPTESEYLKNFGDSVADLNVANLYNNLVIDEDHDKHVRRWVKNIVQGLSDDADNNGIGGMSAASSDDLMAQISENLPGYLAENVSQNEDDSVRKRMKQALLSLPNYSLLNMYAMRNPNQESGESAMSLMEREAAWRYTNPLWFQELAKTPAEGLLRENAHMQAYALMMDYNRYRQLERIEALLAGLLSVNSKFNDALDQLGGMMGNLAPNQGMGNVGQIM